MDKPVELMRLVRIPPSGKLVVQIGKRRFVSLDEIENPKGKQIILAALGDLLAFSGGYEAIVEAGFAPPLSPKMAEPNLELEMTSPPPAETIDAQVVDVIDPEPVPDTELQQKQAAFLAALEKGDLPINEDVQPAAESATMSRSRFSLFNRRSRSTSVEEPLVPQLDIAGELNAILQRYIAQDPDLQSQEINIERGAAGGVRIKVNGDYYEEAANIADPMVRMAIKKATREWEQANP